MNKKVKKLWVSALKSGKFKQGFGKLAYGNQNCQKRCCLGVLSEIAVKKGVCSRRKAFAENKYLCQEVSNWAGLVCKNPYITPISRAGVLNDVNKYSFEKIADLIDQNL